MIHEVLADEAARYVREDDVFGGGVERARDVDLWLGSKGSALVVDRLPGWAAFPRQSGPARLFVLMPGQTGRYRANFRFMVTQCPCDPSWYYEDWLVHISHGEIEGGGFIEREPDQEVDHRVSLYGGSIRSAGGRRLR
ncbi:hypothetical protein [Actinoplanes sp. ATCC 53533]|uniref:hypothetical protein n=1 Tax=Actinoplanes sp. ATCC 53533 TaxID=1288362 RepID=UPI001F1CE5F7|nr:hypothetical protein [Actinoplanes sp. ATCC 53533]